MSDVAKAAGVSLSSVSRVFLGQKKVSQATRRKVLAVAEDIGYVPNPFGHRRGQKDDRTIGLLLRDADNPAYGALFSSLHHVAQKRGWELATMTVNTGKQDDYQVELLHQLLGMKVAGLIVATGDLPSSALEPFMLRVPILRICTPEPDRLVHAVSYDSAAAGAELARLVLEAGHTRIAVVRTCSDISLPEWTNATSAIGTIREAGLEPFIVDVRNDAGADYILPLVQSGAVSVVMCPSDRRQVGFIELFEKSGLSVPGDVSVTGCDGLLPGSEVMGLTTYRWPVERVAETALSQIIDIIGRFGTPNNRLSPVSITIGGELIPGRTLAQVAGE
ncbi:LacI family DNA-binding transcriptional regulator [Corynebacterium liangguodongii]|nr:LacI family DNA-binding transcriptional regulator [Corynebacterium liangguodongii]